MSSNSVWLLHKHFSLDKKNNCSETLNKMNYNFFPCQALLNNAICLCTQTTKKMCQGILRLVPWWKLVKETGSSSIYPLSLQNCQEKLAHHLISEQQKLLLHATSEGSAHKYKPEYIFVPIESDTTWPVKSTSIHELMAVTFGFWLVMDTRLTNPTSRRTREKHRTG